MHLEREQGVAMYWVIAHTPQLMTIFSGGYISVCISMGGHVCMYVCLWGDEGPVYMYVCQWGPCMHVRLSMGE